MFKLIVRLSISISVIFTSAELSAKESCPSWLNQTVPALHSKKTHDLCELTEGKTLLVVNTASYCGFTHQFSQLEKLYQEYKDSGLVIVGFPSNTFNQEDSDASKTAAVCYKNYGVSFPMTASVPVKGPSAHPVFAHLSEAERAPSWNFNKYLISADRTQINHFPSQVAPMSDKLTKAIEAQLTP